MSVRGRPGRHSGGAAPSPRVPPGGSRAVGGVFLPYEEITGCETGEEEAILYWWHLVEVEPPPMAVYEPDSIRPVDVRLPG